MALSAHACRSGWCNGNYDDDDFTHSTMCCACGGGDSCPHCMQLAEITIYNRDGGVVDAPGMYLLGVNFLRRRKSSFIHGAEDDANDLSDHLAAYLRT